LQGEHAVRTTIRSKPKKGGHDEEFFDDDDPDLRTDAEIAQDLLYGNVYSVLCAILGASLGRRLCGCLIRMKNNGERELKLRSQKSLALVHKQMDEISKDEIDPEYLYAELDDEYFVVRDHPHATAPLPFFPSEWQKSSKGPAVEVNVLLIAQMGLLNSCLTVFGQGAAMPPHVHAIAVVVLLALVVFDVAFSLFLKRTINRLRSEGSLAYVPTDHVHRSNHHGKLVYLHDANGDVRRDKKGAKIRAVMDAHVYPPVPCEFPVHADKFFDAIYYEHDAEGNPISADGALVPAYPDDEGIYAASAKPVLINSVEPEPQNAAEVPFKDESFCDRIFLLFRYSLAKTGEWEANSDEAQDFVTGYGCAFNKFGAFGLFYYFVELGRKVLDCFVLAFMTGSAQTNTASVIQCGFNFVFV
jgi:hypothetical protein